MRNKNLYRSAFDWYTKGKEGEIMNEVLKAIGERRSIRAYTDEPVKSEHLEILKTAALQSPSARNLQPYHFAFVTDPEVLKEFTHDAQVALSRRENAGALVKDPSYDVRYKAPLVVFIFATIPGNFTLVDCGIACENLALAAHDLGLGSVILGMPRDVFHSEFAEKWYQRLCPNEKGEFAIAIAIGHPAATKDAHPVREGLITCI